MGTKKQDRDVRLKKELLQMLGESNESVRQAFEQFDSKVGQGFQAMEFKMAVLMLAMEKLGISQEKLQEIANSLQKNAGGDKNEQTKGGTPPTEGLPNNPESEEQPPSDEGGDEHFG